MNYDIYPTRGSFLPGERIEFEIENAGKADEIDMVIWTIDGETFQFNLTIKGGSSILMLPQHDWSVGGYGVEAYFRGKGDTLAKGYTAFDVIPEGQIVRYGFLSDFSTEDFDEVDVKSMARMHVNAVQFYDWDYRHDELVSENEVYTDMMGKHKDLSVIREKIRQCHCHGMKTLGYAPVYAASWVYQRMHPEQSLYNGEGEPLCFLHTFCIMNPARGNGWRTHILQQYRRAMGKVGFDGIHMDTYGFPKDALNSEGKPVYLEEELPKFVEDACHISGLSGEPPFLIFNNVGGWPISNVGHLSGRAVYIEVWPPGDQYHHLGDLISIGRKAGKPVILAAYPEAFRTDSPQRALECQLFLSFVIAMHGGTQLFFGEENAVLTQGYYADYTKLNELQLHWIRAYQDFFVQYEALFMDETMEDVSMTHQGWDNQEYLFSPEGSADGRGGALWYHIRENHLRKAVYVVNLSENNAFWNQGKNSPSERVNVEIQIQVLQNPRSVWFASPDQMHGQRVELEYRFIQTEQSAVINLNIDILRCGVVVVETGI